MACFRPLSAALVLVFLAVVPGRGQTPADPSGHWEGKIQIPNHELAVAVDLAKTAAGEWIGSVSIPDSVTDVPLSDIAVNGQAVRFSAALPGKTTFDGSLSAASGVSGTVSNVEGGVPFQLTRAGDASVKLPPASSVLPKAFDGTWEGVVDKDGKSRRVLIRLWPAADGTALAAVVAVDQGNLEIPVTTVTVHDNELALDVRAVSGTYRGTLGADGAITGEWREHSTRMALTVRRSSHDAK
ncbi:MAG TPA: hypothetical protein VGJ29_05610 [Vicinamibacterales bacterium]|jgi:hypothetical protein